MDRPEHPLSSKTAFLRWATSVELHESDLSRKLSPWDVVIESRHSPCLRLAIAQRVTRLYIGNLTDARVIEQVGSWKAYIIEQPMITVIDQGSSIDACGLCLSLIINNDYASPTCYRCTIRRQHIAKYRLAAVLLSAHTGALNADCTGYIRAMLARLVSTLLIEMPYK